MYSPAGMKYLELSVSSWCRLAEAVCGGLQTAHKTRDKREERKEKKRLSLLQTRRMLNTRVFNEIYPPPPLLLSSFASSFLFFNIILSFFFLLPPSLPSATQERKHAKQRQLLKLYVCLSPSVIVVDFDRCPQKHCSICAPFWRNGLRILIDLGWWEPFLNPNNRTALSQHRRVRQHSVASQPASLCRLRGSPSKRQKGTVCGTNYAKTRHLEWSPTPPTTTTRLSLSLFPF